MGLLDEAIRDHLELKRRHGADEDELARKEAEAFGSAPLGEYDEDEPFADLDASPGRTETGEPDEDETAYDRAAEAGITGDRDVPEFEWHGSAGDDIEVPSYVVDETIVEQRPEERARTPRVGEHEHPATEEQLAASTEPETDDRRLAAGEWPGGDPEEEPAERPHDAITDAPTEFFTPLDAEPSFGAGGAVAPEEGEVEESAAADAGDWGRPSRAEPEDPAAELEGLSAEHPVDGPEDSGRDHLAGLRGGAYEEEPPGDRLPLEQERAAPPEPRPYSVVDDEPSLEPMRPGEPPPERVSPDEPSLEPIAPAEPPGAEERFEDPVDQATEYFPIEERPLYEPAPDAEARPDEPLDVAPLEPPALEPEPIEPPAAPPAGEMGRVERDLSPSELPREKPERPADPQPTVQYDVLAAQESLDEGTAGVGPWRSEEEARLAGEQLSDEDQLSEPEPLSAEAYRAAEEDLGGPRELTEEAPLSEGASDVPLLPPDELEDERADPRSTRGFFENTQQHEGVRREQRQGDDPDFAG